VVLARKVIVHSFTNTPQRLSVFDTHENDAGASAAGARPIRVAAANALQRRRGVAVRRSSGVCALCASANNALLAIPGHAPGQVYLVDIGSTRKFSLTIQVRCRTAAAQPRRRP